jgi:hypothetical protein
MMNILPPGAEPLMVNVRQTGGSPKLTRAAGQDNSDPAVAEEFLAAGAAGDGAGPPPVPAAAAAVTTAAAVTRWPGTATPLTAPVTYAMR